MRTPTFRRRRRAHAKSNYVEGRVPTAFVDGLSDADLQRLNSLLPWSCFTVDANGRRFGQPAWEGKRSDPQPVPDRRIELFDQRFGLADKHVLEVGCFEGVHTIALCERARAVTAIDGRIENVVKTIVRCAFFDKHPTVFTHDIERADPGNPRLRADLCHHMGVLYHLSDPVTHLRQLSDWTGHGLMLDSHYVNPEDVDGEYESGGRSYPYRRFGEARADPFSGMVDHSKWLQLDDIVATLREAGFAHVEMAEQRQERNGPRLLLFAEKG
jgi:SAM-dependent methyltransferase